MNRLEPPDDGVRRFRPGRLIVLASLAVLLFSALIFISIKNRLTTEQAPSKAPVLIVEDVIEEIREPAPPKIDPNHPLTGPRRLFLADGSLYRYQELTFTRELSSQHPHPLAVLQKNDPCLWEFLPISDRPHHYRILCADQNYPDELGKNLTYTRVLDDPLIGDAVLSDELPPYITLRHHDPCIWEVRRTPHQDQYELYCRLGAAPFLDQSLSWFTDQLDLNSDTVTATLGLNGNPSWWILPPDQTPEIPPRSTHLLIVPRTDLDPDDLAKASAHLAENDHDIFQVTIKTLSDQFDRSARNQSIHLFSTDLNPKDPILAHEKFPSLLSLDQLIGQATNQPTSDLFPLIFPLGIAIHTHEIVSLDFQNLEFWQNTWEELEYFQTHLDESAPSNGRIYQGPKFLYFFTRID